MFTSSCHSKWTSYLEFALPSPTLTRISRGLTASSDCMSTAGILTLYSQRDPPFSILSFVRLITINSVHSLRILGNVMSSKFLHKEIRFAKSVRFILKFFANFCSKPSPIVLDDICHASVQRKGRGLRRRRDRRLRQPVQVLLVSGSVDRRNRRQIRRGGAVGPGRRQLPQRIRRRSQTLRILKGRVVTEAMEVAGRE